MRWADAVLAQSTTGRRIQFLTVPNICCRIPASATATLMNDPLMSYLNTHVRTRQSDPDSAMLASPASSGDAAALLNSFSSQSSVQYAELEFLHVLGEGSFGRVSSAVCFQSAVCSARVTGLVEDSAH